MLVLITYDVSTEFNEGRKRLRKVAKLCEDYGQRVQNSVFECSIDMALWVQVKAKLLAVVNVEQDSLRFYFLGSNWERKVEHYGTKQSYHPDGPLIV